MSGDKDKSVLKPEDDQGLFVEKDREIHRSLRRFGRYVAVVKVGEQGRLFRDGALERDLPPGHHSWWGVPFSKYTMSIINSKVILLKIVAYGAITGPLDELGKPTPPIKVIVPLRFSVRLADINTLLTTEPFPTLEAMIKDRVTKGIGKLLFNELASEWVHQLQDDLEHYLQNNSISRTGLQVLDLYVDAPQGETADDERKIKQLSKSQDQEYALREQAKRETAQRAGKMLNSHTERTIKVADAQASDQIRVGGATARKSESDILGTASILMVQELIRTPEGLEVIKANKELRETAISAGLLTNFGLLPEMPTQVPPPAQGGYLPPGQPSDTVQVFSTEDNRTSAAWPEQASYTPPASDSRPMPVTGEFKEVEVPQKKPTLPTDGRVDPERLKAERNAFSNNGYKIDETPAVIEDDSGRSVRGYQFTVTSTDLAKRFNVIFDLTPGFPEEPPIVWVRWGKAKSERYRGRAVRDWSEDSWLNDILVELANSSQA